MKTIREVIQLATDYLQKRGIANARYEAECLLADLLAMNRLDLYLDFDKPLTSHEIHLYRERLVRRSKGEPLQYIKGEVEFCEIKLKMTPDVLIPRHETELLVDLIVKNSRKKDLKGKVLWDLCCGSGCIGLALKKIFPDLQVTLADISHTALHIAQENALRNALDVTFVQGDLFLPFLGQKADFIVCNPPYISEQEFETLGQEVKDYEPRLALVAGVSGVEFYDRIGKELKDYLLPAGSAWFEIGYQQGDTVLDIFRKNGWSECSVEKDLAGHDRFLSVQN